MSPKQYSDTSTAPVSGSADIACTCPTPAQVGPAADVVAVEPVGPVEVEVPVDAVVLLVVVVLVDVLVPGPAAPAVAAAVAESDPPPLPQAAISGAINIAAMHAETRRIYLRINVFPR